MNDEAILQMYREGYSIEYIVDEVFRKANSTARIYNKSFNHVIFTKDYVKKEKVRARVYRLLYKDYMVNNK